MNNIGAAPPSNFRGNEWAAYDRLPPSVRRCLQEALLDWDARVCRWEINKMVKSGCAPERAVALQIETILEADDREVMHFSHYWPSRFGKYPPLAAGATIMRYNEAAKRSARRELG